jgi:putative MATE family efflux protein
MAMGSITMNIAQLGEAVYLGFLGTEALAAMGFAYPITITLFAFAAGIGTGASSVIARAAGGGDRGNVRRLVSHAQLLAVLVGTILAIVGYFAAPSIASLLGAQDTVRSMTIEYLQVYMIGMPFFLLSIVGSTLLRATGSAASPGIIMTAGSIIQIILCPLFIFDSFGGFGLDLGIAGAAWAYVASRFISVFLFALLLVRARMVHWSFVGLLNSWKAILYVGGPAIASGLVQPLSMAIITRLLASHGHEVVAGFNVASRVETMAHMILWSVYSSSEPFIGQNWGAKFYDRAKLALTLCHRFCLAWGVLTFAVMMLVGTTLVGMIDDNPIVIDVARSFFLVIPLSIGFMGMMSVASSCFNALGKPFPPFVISLLRTLILYVPLAIVANRLWGYQGIFIATAVTNVVVGLIAWAWNRSYVYKTAALVS